MTVDVHQFPCLDDNYGFLLRDRASGMVACVDTPDADRILAEMKALGWGLDLILNTHWHPDHAGGNARLMEATGARAIGPAEVQGHYPVDEIVADGDQFVLGETAVRVMDSGGHTLGHIVYHLSDDAMLFVGDTLFPMGCGRVFEGTAEQMWASLDRLSRLPEETRVYSAHEYTLGNAQFACSVDPSDAVIERAATVTDMRARGEPTVPTTIGEERATNPFLRASLLAIARDAASEAEAFARVRAAKDEFKG
ncbi:hydroxyacylglutathione hydrolase [Sphingobium sp. JS3065]|uniref:hydroxyacylglutathione hydrolase n=1 Tax=Sphingobium sp. JS3065 TaxID=2970925 RepID=UPI0022641765|nr:hydroxyacylglutathione hydrolase [Sphingobium sp. JS3065]UZW57074.1 hydroxyacylglutathione hydrolase [Sphingobium sp. JS3065]